MTSDNPARASILNRLRSRRIDDEDEKARHRVEPAYGNQEHFLKQLAANGTVTEPALSVRDALNKIRELSLQQGWSVKPAIAPSIHKMLTDDHQWDVDNPDLSLPESIAITQAYCGISDTGSIVCLSSPDNPTTYHFLAEHHIVLLQENRIMQCKHDVWALMRQEQMAAPRAINIISGPSRTADIEQTIQLGAHGPRSLTVFLINDLIP